MSEAKESVYNPTVRAVEDAKDYYFDEEWYPHHWFDDGHDWRRVFQVGIWDRKFMHRVGGGLFRKGRLEQDRLSILAWVEVASRPELLHTRTGLVRPDLDLDELTTYLNERALQINDVTAEVLEQRLAEFMEIDEIE